MRTDEPWLERSDIENFTEEGLRIWPLPEGLGQERAAEGANDLEAST
jgi:hypothetical protein